MQAAVIPTRRATALHIDEPDWIARAPRNHAIFNTLVLFLHNAAASDTDWTSLLDTTIATLHSLGTNNPSAEEYKLESHVLYAILLTVVKRIHPTSEDHDHLVKLVLAIRDMPLPPSVIQTIDPYDRNNEIHLELTSLIGAYSDFERDAPLSPPLEDRSTTPVKPTRAPWRLPHNQCLSPKEWASINAFAAKIHTAQPEITKLAVRGIFAMIEALEEPLTGAQLEDVLPAASVWIVYARAALKANDVPYVCYLTESKRMPWSRGALWEGRHAFSEERWQFWMRRFEEVAGREDVSGAVRLAALEAVEIGSGV